MKKTFLLLFVVVNLTIQLAAQKEKKPARTTEDVQSDGEKVPFKENLFTGGTISLAFYNNTFLVGGSPVFGCSVTNWIDLGIVVNYNYTSYRDYNFVFNDKVRQSVYGGGVFTKIYPIRFLFVQAQVEHNFIRQKFIPNVGTPQTIKNDATSYLIGGGYTTGRSGRGGQPFYYLAVLFDISNDVNSPYTDAYGRTIPIIRGGLQVPLFQGGKK